MRRPHLLLGVAFFSGWVASWSPTDATGPLDSHLFPAPNRPVATIITPAYSDEKTRDHRGEAERVMNRVGIRPGMRVADIGAGDGYYTVRLARRLGSAATIYAEDVKAEYLGRLASRLKREGISGVTLIRGEPGNPKLPPAAIDLAILAHMYHEIENPYEFLSRLRPLIRPPTRGSRSSISISPPKITVRRRRSCDVSWPPSATGRSTSSCSHRQTATSRSSPRPTSSRPSRRSGPAHSERTIWRGFDIHAGCR